VQHNAMRLPVKLIFNTQQMPWRRLIPCVATARAAAIGGRLGAVLHLLLLRKAAALSDAVDLLSQ
jgi:hypothetical protein